MTIGVLAFALGRPELEEAFAAAGADEWSNRAIRRHMAGAVTNPVLKVLYLTCGRWAKIAALVLTLAIAVAAAQGAAWWVGDNLLSLIWQPRGGDAAGGVLLLTAIVVGAVFIQLFKGSDHWITAKVSADGKYLRWVTENASETRSVSGVAFQILGEVQKTYPDAKGFISYVGKDPIFSIQLHALSLSHHPALVWDEINGKDVRVPPPR